MTRSPWSDWLDWNRDGRPEDREAARPNCRRQDVAARHETQPALIEAQGQPRRAERRGTMWGPGRLRSDEQWEPRHTQVHCRDGGGMTKQDARRRSGRTGVARVQVPRWILERMGEMTDEALRLVLAFLTIESREGKGIGVPVAELAEKAGLSQGRAKLALTALGLQRFAEPVEPGVWRLLALGPPADDEG